MEESLSKVSHEQSKRYQVPPLSVEELTQGGSVGLAPSVRAVFSLLIWAHRVTQGPFLVQQAVCLWVLEGYL